MRRPIVFTRDVQRRRGERMGLDLNYSEKGTSLVVTAVPRGGAIHRCAPDIVPGDRIISVSGNSGTPVQLLELLKSLEEMQLEISRCFSDSAAGAAP